MNRAILVGALGADWVQIVLLCLLLLGLSVLLAAVALWVRAWSRRDTKFGGGFSLDDLRQMQRRGQISPEELARAKAALSARALRSAPAPESPDNHQDSNNCPPGHMPLR